MTPLSGLDSTLILLITVTWLQDPKEKYWPKGFSLPLLTIHNAKKCPLSSTLQYKQCWTPELEQAPG